jgi:hypothetical protein
LEQLLYQQTGFGPRTPAFDVHPCSRFVMNTFDTGRMDAAEWIRAGYHDMATADVDAGTGGMDASIGFPEELERAENPGKAFNDTIRFFNDFFTVRSSMADLLALGVVLAAESCSDGAMRVPYRAGRIDATAAGPPGVPEPHQNITSHTDSFRKQGFNVTEMIGLVACGHSVGGVHGKDFNEIVPVPAVIDPV